MSKWIVDIHGDIEGDYKIIGEYAEPKTGHWVKTPKAVMGEGYMWYCDKCGHEVYQDSSRDYPSENFCPNCGVRMVEPQESGVQDADSD